MTAQRRGRNGYGGRRRQQQQQQQQQQVQPAALQSTSSDEESTDTGSVTRCVCGESHNVGLMVQCDQCEVWQHCECVGLAEEKDIPDQYYCEQCKPQNHAVVKLAHGRTRRSYSSIGRPNTTAPVDKKAPKKRMTFNSREASMSLEDVLAARSALEVNFPPLNESAPSSPVDAPLMSEDAIEQHQQQQQQQQQKLKSEKQKEADEEQPQHLQHTLPQPLKQQKKSSPVVQESDDMDVDVKEQGIETADSEADNAMVTTPTTSTTTTGKPSKPKRSSSGRKADGEGGNGVEKGRVSKTEKRSRGGGPRRNNASTSRRAQASRPRSRTSTPQPESGGNGNTNGGQLSNNNNNNNNNNTVDISTAIFEKLSPAAREASPPAKVRLPSSRMTISEMNRRAKQILEYISSIQVEMATKEVSTSMMVNVSTVVMNNSNNNGSESNTPTNDNNNSNNSKDKKPSKRSPKPTAITIPEKSKNGEDDGPSSSLSSASTIPLDESEVQQRNAEMMAEKGIAEEAIEKAKSEQTSMEIMDTLTRELIRFQRRFGSTQDSGRHARSRYLRDNNDGSGSEGEGRITRSREASASSAGTSNILFEKRAAHT